MINVKNLSRKFDQLTAVNSISFNIKKGEVVGFLGPNGAGKTTTMKILCCFLPPTSGDVKIAGINILDDPLSVRKKIGYLPENFPLYEDMVVWEYLSYIAEIRQISSKDRRAKILDIANRCGLKKVVGRYIEELSKGYRQRVGLAQAMIHNPDILILDEPTTGLDPNQIVDIRKLIRDIGKEKTVLLSTHILPEVAATSDRVLIINDGAIVADGTTAELQARQTGTQLIHISFSENFKDAPAVIKNLSTVERLTENKKDSNGVPEYLVEAKKGADIRRDLFNIAVKNNWPIMEMHIEEMSLEDVFRKFTT